MREKSEKCMFLGKVYTRNRNRNDLLAVTSTYRLKNVILYDNNTCKDYDSGGVRIAESCLRSTPHRSTGLLELTVDITKVLILCLHVIFTILYIFNQRMQFLFLYFGFTLRVN